MLKVVWFLMIEICSNQSMKIKSILLAATGIFASIATSSGAVIYSADFSTAGVGWTHTTTTPPAPGPQSVNGSNYTLSYPGTPSTDGSVNSYITSGGNLTASDWGGSGAFATMAINISGLSSVTIAMIASGTFNAASENFIWYYSIDGGAAVTAPKATGDFSQTWASVDVSGASSLTVGFTFNHDGGSDSFNVSSITVDTVPEPTIATMAGLLGTIGLLRRRRL